MNSSCRRSSSLRRLASVALLLVAGLAGAPAPAAQTLKCATLVPEGSIWDKAEREFASKVQTATGGRVKFQFYPGGVAGDEPDFVRKMRLGQLQAGLMSSSGLGDLDPSFFLFQVPLLFETDEEILAVLNGMRAGFEQRLAEKGFVLVHWTNVGWLHIFSSKPLASFEDFKRQKQFVWGNDGRLAGWYQELGLQPVSLAGTDVLQGLQTGLIDALPATPLAALSLQWFRSAPHALEHRFAPLLGGLIVTKSAWSKLSEADRAAIAPLAAETEKKLFAEVPVREKEALAEMQKRGLTLAPEPTGDAEKWLALGKAFQERFRTHSVPPAIFDEGLKLLEARRKAR